MPGKYVQPTGEELTPPFLLRRIPVDPSFGALFGRLKFTVRRHKSNKDSLAFVGRRHRGRDRRDVSARLRARFSGEE